MINRKGLHRFMLKRKVLILGVTAAISLISAAIPVKADMVTASNMIPQLNAQYHVNEAEANLKNKIDTLIAYQNAHAGAYDIARAQAEVNAASLVLNSLNTMVANDTMLIAAMPAPVDCGQLYQSQALLAQATWTDYINRAKADQAALNSTYAAQIIAANQNELINQAALAHRYSTAASNPVTGRAIANWTELNNIVSDRNAFAMAITANPTYSR